MAIAAGLGPNVLGEVIELVARDGWAQWAGGLPDLLLWTLGVLDWGYSNIRCIGMVEWVDAWCA